MGETHKTAAMLSSEMQASFGPVCASLSEASLSEETLFSDDYLELGRSSFLFRSPAGIRFYYRKGGGLTVQMPADAGQDELQIFLQGTVFGAVAWLNGLLPLHASAVARDGRVIAFTADSGGGKSTLAAGMSALGWSHFCDDTLVLQPSASEVTAFPDGKPIKLWEDAFALVKAERGGPITLQPGKHFANLPAKASQPGTLTDLIFLEYGDEIALTPITGAAKLSLLPETFYRIYIHLALGNSGAHARFMENLASNLRFWKCTRPKGKAHFDLTLDVLSAIET